MYDFAINQGILYGWYIGEVSNSILKIDEGLIALAERYVATNRQFI